MRVIFCALAALCSVPAVVTQTVSAQNTIAPGWPQGPGPLGSYVAKGSAPAEWSVVHKRNIAWARRLPETGQSTVVIFDGKLFYTCYQPLGADSELGSNIIAYCADAKSGKVLWQNKIEAKYPLRLSGASLTARRRRL